jgi:hypothetical protein
MQPKDSGIQQIHPTDGKMHAPHRGIEVAVGAFRIRLGGTEYLTREDLSAHVLIALTDCLEFGREFVMTQGDAAELTQLGLMPPLPQDRACRILSGRMKDLAGVPKGWATFLADKVIPLLESTSVLAFCRAGHGRTGTLLASLVALLEPDTEDPIASARTRYCCHAVETLGQAEAVFALRGQDVPQKYVARQR